MKPLRNFFFPEASTWRPSSVTIRAMSSRRQTVRVVTLRVEIILLVLSVCCFLNERVGFCLVAWLSSMFFFLACELTTDRDSPSSFHLIYCRSSWCRESARAKASSGATLDEGWSQVGNDWQHHFFVNTRPQTELTWP